LTEELETLVCRLFRDGVQFCSGLVDLVVCVRHHLGGGHRSALAGQRFVGLVAEDIAEMGDRGADVGEERSRCLADMRNSQCDLCSDCIDALTRAETRRSPSPALAGGLPTVILVYESFILIL